MTINDFKPGDIVQHPKRHLNGFVVNGDGETIRVLHLTSLGIVTTTSDLDGWERVMSVLRPGYVQVRVNDLDLSRWEGAFEGGWNHATRVAIRAANAIAAQRDESAPPADEPEIVGDGCECWVTPEHMWTTYGSAVEPGSQVEYNPDCPKHGDTGPSNADAERDANVEATPQATPETHPDEPADRITLPAGSLRLTSVTVTLPCPDCGEDITDTASLGTEDEGGYFLDFANSETHTCPPAQPDEPTEFGARVTVTPDLSGASERWCRQHDEYWASENGALSTWAYLFQRGTVTLGWDE